MDKMARKDAAAAGIGQYFTGKPCKYGHVTYRYTQSGACAECVSIAAATSRQVARDAAPRVRARLAEQRQQMLAPVLAARTERQAAKDALAEIRVPIHVQDLETVFETAVGLCLAAHPCLERADVWPSSKPVRGGNPLYLVKVPPEHAALMHSIASQLWSAKGPDLSRVHDRVAAAVVKQADDDAEEPPENYK